MKHSKPFRLSWARTLLVATACGAPLALAAPLGGSVALADGTRVAGAMVTLADADGHTITAYTDMQGRWQLDPPAQAHAGGMTLRVRAGAAYADYNLPMDNAAALPEPIVLRKLASVAEVSDRLTASAHAASVRWESAGTKQTFVSQCQFCHQIGNAWTRKPRSEDEWTTVIKRMEGYGSLITWKDEADFARTLSRSFAGKPVNAVQTLSMHGDLPKATMREWSFGGGLNYVHDIEDGKDGRLYGVDMSADGIWILDLKSNATEFVQFPANGLPLGGMFSGALAPMGTFAAHHGPHSIVRGSDGRMYMTCSLSGEICIFDPRTRRTEFIAIGEDAIYPHTLRFDRNGTLWFTLALSNQIGRMDVKTKKITLIDLPSHGVARWLTDALLPTGLKVASWFPKENLQVTLSHHKATGLGREVINVPYGIDINPVDGSIWYSKLLSGYIGRVDPVTLAVEEFPTPHSAPRRLRFDKAGTLWIPSFDTGHLMKFDPQQRRFLASYKLPTLASNEYETPYALAVHPKTRQVWIASNMSDRILRFDPATETFAAYPSPTRVTFMRDFVFLDDGQVCTSNSNLPASAIEGGKGKFICLDAQATP